MRKSRYSESRIAAILQEADAGLAVVEVARKHGISAATFYQWRSRYSGMSVSDMQRREAVAWAMEDKQLGQRRVPPDDTTARHTASNPAGASGG